MPLQWWLLLSLLCWFLLVALLSDYRRLGCRPGSSLSRTALGISSPHTLCITNKPGPVALNNTPFSIQLLWVRARFSVGGISQAAIRAAHRVSSEGWTGEEQLPRSLTWFWPDSVPLGRLDPGPSTPAFVSPAQSPFLSSAL